MLGSFYVVWMSSYLTKPYHFLGFFRGESVINTLVSVKPIVSSVYDHFNHIRASFIDFIHHGLSLVSSFRIFLQVLFGFLCFTFVYFSTSFSWVSLFFIFTLSQRNHRIYWPSKFHKHIPWSQFNLYFPRFVSARSWKRSIFARKNIATIVVLNPYEGGGFEDGAVILSLQATTVIEV